MPPLTNVDMIFEHDGTELLEFLKKRKCLKTLVVADSSFEFLPIAEKIKKLDVDKVYFSGFHPNPLYEEVVKGVKAFKKGKCDSIMAVGGGSAIDVAKCIKLFAKAKDESKGGNYLDQDLGDINISDIPLIAIPTTAGTGSEATRYAVIYYNGEKQSVTDKRIIPDLAVLWPEVLATLPPYQKRATFLDALCHCIESIWSVNADQISARLAKFAAGHLMMNYARYFGVGKKQVTINDKNALDVWSEMMSSAYNAGRAINITQTTAGHAMSYKLTSLYGIAHGHAAASCVRVCFEKMLDEITEDIFGIPLPKKGFEELYSRLAFSAKMVFDCLPEEFCERFDKMMSELGLEYPKIKAEDVPLLASSVNPVRLKNHPFTFKNEHFVEMYSKFVEK